MSFTVTPNALPQCQVLPSSLKSRFVSCLKAFVFRQEMLIHQQMLETPHRWPHLTSNEQTESMMRKSASCCPFILPTLTVGTNHFYPPRHWEIRIWEGLSPTCPACHGVSGHFTETLVEARLTRGLDWTGCPPWLHSQGWQLVPADSVRLSRH